MLSTSILRSRLARGPFQGNLAIASLKPYLANILKIWELRCSFLVGLYIVDTDFLQTRYETKTLPFSQHSRQKVKIPGLAASYREDRLIGFHLIQILFNLFNIIAVVIADHQLGNHGNDSNRRNGRKNHP